MNLAAYLFVSVMIVMSKMKPLEHALRAYRAEKALEWELPRYCIFGDSVIQGIVSARPRSMRALYELKGMGTERCAKYGEDILGLVRLNATSRRVTVKGGGRDEKLVLAKPRGGDSVYVLELAEGRVYVGKSGDVPRRVGQHMGGGGSAFTKVFPPTGRFLPRLGNVSGGSDAAERDETLRYMFRRGVDKVRGWRYTQVELPAAELEDAERNIRELFDLCRRCGHGGHFVGRCKRAFDRLGRALV